MVDDELIPAANVMILLSPTGETTLTALDGGFSFSFLEPGRYSLLLSPLGYEPVQQPVDVQAGESKDVEVS